MARAQLPRARRAVRIGVRDGDRLQHARAAGQVDPAPVRERRHDQLGDLLERRLDVERAAEREPGVQQEPLADLGAARRGHVLGDAHHEHGAAGAVADRRRLDEQPLLLARGADDPAHEQRLDVVGAVQEAVPRQVLVVQVAPVGVEEREALPQLRQVEPVVRAAGVEHGPRGRVGQDDAPVQVAHVDRVVHVVDQRLELAREGRHARAVQDLRDAQRDRLREPHVGLPERLAPRPGGQHEPAQREAVRPQRGGDQRAEVEPAQRLRPRPVAVPAERRRVDPRPRAPPPARPAAPPRRGRRRRAGAARPPPPPRPARPSARPAACPPRPRRRTGPPPRARGGRGCRAGRRRARARRPPRLRARSGSPAARRPSPRAGALLTATPRPSRRRTGRGG